MSKENPELKAIIIEGKSTLIFDENCPVFIKTEEKPAEKNVDIGQFIQDIIVQNNMTAEEQEKLLNMTLRQFLETCKQAATNITQEDAAQLTLLHKSLRMGHSVKCPACQSATLRIVDGLVKCPVCNTEFGDIDE